MNGLLRTIASFSVKVVVALAMLGADPAWAELDSARIDALAERSVELWPTPGLALSVVDGDAAPLARGYGLRDSHSRRRVDADTLFAIGSCTKSFASATMASLVDRGLVGWEDRVQTHLSWFTASDPGVAHELTIRDILSHRAGLRASMPRQAAFSRRTYLESIARAPPAHAFRAEFAYANDMFTLAGELITTVVRRPWEDDARDHFWAPLGMRRTNLDFRLSRRDTNSATPYLITASGAAAVPWVYEEDVAPPSGGINSTARDMAQWMRFQMSSGEIDGARLLSEASMREMHAPQTVMRGTGAEPQRAFSRALGQGQDGIRFESYAMGWYVHDFRGHTVIWHLGAVPGFRCVMGFLPEDRFGVVALTNADASMQPIALFQDLVEARLGMPDRNWTAIAVGVDRTGREGRRQARTAQEEARGAPTPPSLRLREYAGSFVGDEGGALIAVRAENDRLLLRFGRLLYVATPWSGDVFQLTPVEWRVGDETIRWPYPTTEDPRAFVTFELNDARAITGLRTAFGHFRRADGNGAQNE